MNRNYRPVRNTVQCTICTVSLYEVNLAERPFIYHLDTFFSIYQDDSDKIQAFPDYFESHSTVREEN